MLLIKLSLYCTCVTNSFTPIHRIFFCPVVICTVCTCPSSSISTVHTGDGQNNGNTEKLRNRTCVVYIERTSVRNTEYPRVAALVMCWVTVRVRELENGRLVRFWKKTVRWCACSWSICEKPATLLLISTARVPTVNSAPYTNHVKRTLA
jgi:hypothetical protein